MTLPLPGDRLARRRHHHPHDASGGPHARHEHIETRTRGTREITVVRRVLDANDIIAARNREHFRAHGVFVINLMSSPGSGKTTLLEKTLADLAGRLRCAVIVGDICTTQDADRLAATGVPVVQINTDEFGGDCHLAAHVIERAAAGLDLAAVDLLFVENVGNLVCPAEFDIGEDLRVVVLSVTEGEDKPLKYPLMFRVCEAALINKVDLLPHLEGYDMPTVLTNLRQVHPVITVFEVSARTRSGFDGWLGWLQEKVGDSQRKAESVV